MSTDLDTQIKDLNTEVGNLKDANDARRDRLDSYKQSRTTASSKASSIASQIGASANPTDAMYRQHEAAEAEVESWNTSITMLNEEITAAYALFPLAWPSTDMTLSLLFLLLFAPSEPP
jgi:chromosome segregation ATPase